MDLRVWKFLRKLRTATKDPIWDLVLRLPANTSTTYDALEPLFRPAHISRYQYVNLRPVLAARSLAHLPASPPPAAYPPWLTSHLLTSKVRSAAEAHSALSLAYDTLDTTHPSYHPSLLVLATHALAAHAILAPASRVVRTFVTTPVAAASHAPTLHYNALLHALSAFPASAPAADLAIALLEAMHDQRLPLWPSTYSALLSDRFVTLQLTKMLREKMRYEGVRPDARQLQQYLRIFAKGGAIETSGEYMRAIREYCLENGMTPPLDVTKDAVGLDEKDGSLGSGSIGSVHPANTLYLRALKNDPASAMQYLHKLLRLQDQTPDSPSSTQPQDSQPDTNSPTIPTPDPAPPSSPPKTSVDIHDYTSTLLSLTADHKIPPARVLTMFESLRAKSSPASARPTAVTYTALIRAFLHSKAPPSRVRGRVLSPLQIALMLWLELFDGDGGGGQRLRLDRYAVAVGAQVLVRSGRHEEAYWLLETFARRGRAAIKAGKTGKVPRWRAAAPVHVGPAQRRASEKATRLSTIAVNDFMLSFLRRAPLPLTSSSFAASTDDVFHSTQPMSAADAAHAALDLRVHPREPRPALVFALFAHMHGTFGVHPDAASLGILLKAAVLAGKLERESVGLTVRKAVRSLFGLRGAAGSGDDGRRHGAGGGDGDGAATSMPMTRPPAGPEPLAVLMHSSSTPAVYGRPPIKIKWSGAPADWAGAPAHEVARRIFRGVVLGNWPWLRGVRAGWLPDGPLSSSSSSPARSSAAGKSRLEREFEPEPGPELGSAQVQRGPWALALERHQHAKRGAHAHAPPYPTIHPSPACFGAYIQLLALSPAPSHPLHSVDGSSGAVGGGTRADEIPQVLAWMRALRIVPDRRILAIALVFVSERVYGYPYAEQRRRSRSSSDDLSTSASASASSASASGPSTDFWSTPLVPGADAPGSSAVGTSWMARWGMGMGMGGGQGAELQRRRAVFAQLVAWVDGWVGAPDEREMGEALRAVARMRDRSFGGPTV
ncbi:hypothetical protein CONPUDRAFT_168458 [Coniophora puteana RWD-64-598 SS2]|uniref:Uncharacterized protein n=1 Tax=Coniophora puteana (strain RWD-64-598) TaxID=741705 RepID=A0A5M3MDB0_CONPW|nr:uncharacterized protein CONPUDRAFT_168458 [Coniophora puteana RWD-64-598 SS2]EIW76631.1 hypothetical protein CONPUDRAFT_168458 [Coniophora puteana RWD-64-598 SS2]